jgi:integrase
VSGTTASKTFVVQRDLPGGRTRRVTLGPTNVLTLEAARARAEAVLGEFYAGRDPKAAAKCGKTLGVILNDYLARPGLRDSTRAEYRDMVAGHLKSWLKLPLSEITLDMVETRHRTIAAGIKATGSRSGEARANSVMRVLRALYNYAAEHDPSLTRNPVRLKGHWFEVDRRKRVIKTDQLPAFYRAVCALPNPVARDYLLLLLFTGLRRREAASLRWTDLELRERIIRIPAERTKSDEALDLPMTDFVHDLLVARRALGDARFVFPSNSKSGFIEEPKFPLSAVAAATGIVVSAHDLRRTFITIAESSDISPLALKALVNHALPKGDVTAGYVQMDVARLREPAQQVANKLKQLCGIEDLAGENITKLA